MIGHIGLWLLTAGLAYLYMVQETYAILSQSSHSQRVRTIGSSLAERWQSDPVGAAALGAATNVWGLLNMSVFVVPTCIALSISFEIVRALYRQAMAPTAGR
jgi:hypothetical protein